MSDLNDNDYGFASLAAKAGPPQGVTVEVHMRPDRVGGGLKDDESCGQAPAAEGIRKTYRTGSWYFASDLLDRMADISARECPRIQLRPVKVEIDFVLDDKAYRQVGLVLDSFDRAYRAL